MGAWSSVKLRGIDGSQTLGFSMRADEMVVGATLRIAYDYSPALLADLSHLRIFLNERLVTVEGLPENRNVANTRDIPLDPRLFGDVNELRFNLIGHYSRQCEDPFHSALWLTLSDLGRLDLVLAPVALASDLKNLPAPFLDRRDPLPLKLPFVLAAAPDAATVQAAGVVASWFGMQAGTRGASFPVVLDALPPGNAIVFIKGSGSMAGIKAAPGATISIQPHPTNPNARLLVIGGANDAELARATRAMVLVNPTLAGQSVTVGQEVEAAPRKPYDAPAWMPTDRPVRFGELARPGDLQVRGYFPDVVRVNYRLPPDLFTWRSPGAPMKLRHRASHLPLQRNSTLGINLNNDFIQTLALDGPQPETIQPGARNLLEPIAPAMRQDWLYLPPHAVRGREQLQLAYAFDIPRESECRNLQPDTLQGAIDPESTLDFSAFPHYALLPNLAHFANLGFPFTRMADLSETAVVLPDASNADELGLYLTLMGRMGEATGYPALRHAVVRASEVERMVGRDLIVIGSAERQSLMSKWAERLPMVQANGVRAVRTPDSAWLPSYRWDRADERGARPLPTNTGSVSLAQRGRLAAVMGFESPLQAERSVVVLYADVSADLRKIGDLLTDPERSGAIQGDFSIVDDQSVSNVMVGRTYHAGSLPLLGRVHWFFADYPLLFALSALVICLLLAALLYRIRRRIRSGTARKLPLS